MVVAKTTPLFPYKRPFKVPRVKFVVEAFVTSMRPPSNPVLAVMRVEERFATTPPVVTSILVEEMFVRSPRADWRYVEAVSWVPDPEVKASVGKRP